MRRKQRDDAADETPRTFDTADGNGAWSRKAVAVARSAEPNVCGPKAGNRVTIQKASKAAPIAKRPKPDVAFTAL